MEKNATKANLKKNFYKNLINFILNGMLLLRNN